jgi:sensor histidine kinase YesM
MNTWEQQKEIIMPVNESYLKELARSTFFYSPVVAPLVLMLITGFHNLYERWVTGFVISLTVSYTCIAGSALINFAVEPAIMKALRRPVQTHSRGWWLSISMFLIFPGLYLGFMVNGMIHRALGLGADYSDSILADYRVGFVIGSIIAIGFFLLKSRRESKELQRQSELKMKSLENKHLESQISALTAQMNPHLLFNALNTVASLVAIDPGKSEEIIVTLSELYRGVLNSSKNMSHSLRTELDLCEAYLKIEKARFGERIHSEVIIEGDFDQNTIQIPALCLQPLVENAVKHGISKKALGGKIKIRASCQQNRLRVVVADNGVGFNSVNQKTSRKTDGTGTGLNNSQKRIHLQYGIQGLFKITSALDTGTSIEIEIPIQTLECDL